ncbi:hypothetical protein ACTMU2_15440 [Cupriavidus basilensis]
MLDSAGPKALYVAEAETVDAMLKLEASTGVGSTHLAKPSSGQTAC